MTSTQHKHTSILDAPTSKDLASKELEDEYHNVHCIWVWDLEGRQVLLAV
jgi:hypothetical protein